MKEISKPKALTTVAKDLKKSLKIIGNKIVKGNLCFFILLFNFLYVLCRFVRRYILVDENVISDNDAIGSDS